MSFRRICGYHGLPFVAVWGLYLAAFWPGILSEDSLVQWRQIVTLELDPYTAPVHTLTNWLITRLWFSPAAVAMMQIAALALALCGVLWVAARAGAPAWLRWTTAIWLTLLPANGLLSITLWKDIPYTIAHLAVAALSFPILRTRGDALRKPAVAAGLVIALAAVGLYRHNGLPVAAGYLVILLLLTAGAARLRALAVAVATMAVIVGIQWSVNSAFRMPPIRAALAYQTPLHQVAAVIAADAPLDPEDRQLLEQLAPLATWKARYHCEQMLPIILDGGVNWDTLDRERAPFMRAWRRLILRHPAIVLKHQACATAMVWWPAATEALAYTATPSWGRLLGVDNQSRAERTRTWLVWVNDVSSVPAARWLLWGPALHWWLLVACVCIVTRRRGFGWMLLPFAPAVLHTLVLFAVLPSPEFRLQYPVYLIGILAPLMTSALLRSPEPNPALR